MVRDPVHTTPEHAFVQVFDVPVRRRSDFGGERGVVLQTAAAPFGGDWPGVNPRQLPSPPSPLLPGASPPLCKPGQQGAAGQDLGQQGAAGVLYCRHRGSQRLLLGVRGVRARARVRDRVVPLSPRRGAPPPLPPWAGRAGTGAQQCDKGGQGSTWGRPSAAPLAAQGHGSLSAGPRGGGGGGLLSLGFTRYVQPSGRGDAQHPTAAPAGVDGGAHGPRSGQGRSSEDPT